MTIWTRIVFLGAVILLAGNSLGCGSTAPPEPGAKPGPADPADDPTADAEVDASAAADQSTP